MYVIRMGKTDLYKIGWALGSTNRRLKQLQTGNPEKLEILMDFRVSDAESLEKYLHYFLLNKNVRGEWFQLSEEDLSWLSWFCEAYDLDMRKEDGTLK